MLLFLLCAAANDDYVALKAFYESTGGSGWNDNIFWDMSKTDVCGVPQWGNGYDVQCSGGRVTHLCASANAALSSVVSPLTLAPPSCSQDDGYAEQHPDRHATSWRRSANSFVSRGARRLRCGRARRPAGTPPPSATPFAASSTSMEGRSSTRLIRRTAKRGRPGALAYRPLTKIYRRAPAGLGTRSTRASSRNAEFYSTSCGHRLSSFLDANTPSNHAEKFASIAFSTSGRACGPIAKSWRSPRSASRS